MDPFNNESSPEVPVEEQYFDTQMLIYVIIHIILIVIGIIGNGYATWLWRSVKDGTKTHDMSLLLSNWLHIILEILHIPWIFIPGFYEGFYICHGMAIMWIVGFNGTVMTNCALHVQLYSQFESVCWACRPVVSVLIIWLLAVVSFVGSRLTGQLPVLTEPVCFFDLEIWAHVGHLTLCVILVMISVVYASKTRSKIRNQADQSLQTRSNQHLTRNILISAVIFGPLFVFYVLKIAQHFLVWNSTVVSLLGVLCAGLGNILSPYCLIKTYK